MMAEVLDSGRTWEEQVLTTRLTGRAIVAEGDGALADRIWSVEESIELLRRAQQGEFLYQLTLSCARIPVRGIGHRPGADRDHRQPARFS